MLRQMNIELLTQLANKAMSEPPYDGSADRWGIFAELIIQECYQVCKDNLVPLSEYDSDEAFKYNEGVTDCVKMLKKHFGVEE